MSIVAWHELFDVLQTGLKFGRKALAKDTVYIYRVASTHFRAAFSLYLTQPEGDWPALFQEALRLFALSVETDDCQNRHDYPFNLARLYVEWYLGQWLLGEQPNMDLLDQSINLYVDGLWAREQQSLSTFSVLPIGYLLRQDTERLQAFWQMLAQQTSLKQLTGEIALWYEWSELFLKTPESSAKAEEGFFQAYADFRRHLNDPTQQPVKFYLAAAKIALDGFSLTGTALSVISRLAVEPW